MKSKEEIVRNWLPRYTGEKLENFGKYILLTNFSNYVRLFSEWNGVEIAGIDKPMQCATWDGITIINFGMGSPTAATVMDLLSSIEPEAVFVKKSTLPGVGKGLFTRRAIAKGERIIEYKGRITTFKQVQESGVVNPYIYYVNRNHVIDAMQFPESAGRYVNDAEGPVTIPGCSNNARFIVINKRVFFEAITDILPGAEIFVRMEKAIGTPLHLINW